MDIKISVIIPTYNRKNYILRAVNSVLKQTYTNFELIIIDDASSDETESIVNDYLENYFTRNKLSDFEFSKKKIKNSNDTFINILKDYERKEKVFFKKFSNFKKYKTYVYYDDNFNDVVKYIKLEKNKGVSFARNFGISLSKAELIAFLDSDDEWLNTKLEKQLHLYKNEKYKLCHTNEIWIRNSKRVNQMKKHQKSGAYIFDKCLARCVISPSSVVIEKDVFKEIGFFNESFKICEDYDLWLRICVKYPVSFIDENLIIKYGGHADQLSRLTWGNDIYRVKALENILKNKLDKDKKEKVIKMLLIKAKILKNGFKKRFKFFSYLKYKFLINKYKNFN